MWFPFGEVSSSSWCLERAVLFYCGTPWAFRINILNEKIVNLDIGKVLFQIKLSCLFINTYPIVSSNITFKRKTINNIREYIYCEEILFLKI